MEREGIGVAKKDFLYRLPDQHHTEDVQVHEDRERPKGREGLNKRDEIREARKSVGERNRRGRARDTELRPSGSAF